MPREKTAVVAMGNPYLASDFPKIENYMCTFSNATVSEVAAVKALFGEIPIRGHLPVTIPNVAQRGAGLERPAQVAREGAGNASELSMNWQALRPWLLQSCCFLRAAST